VSEDAQHRQDRANQEYMQERQERSKRCSVWMAAGSLILSVAFLVGTAYFTGGAMSLLFLAQCISVVVAIASLWILHLQEELRNDTTLSEEERESAQDNLSFWRLWICLWPAVFQTKPAAPDKQVWQGHYFAKKLSQQARKKPTSSGLHKTISH